MSSGGGLCCQQGQNLNPHPKLFCTFFECSFSALQNFADLFPDSRILKSTTLVGEFGKIARPVRAAFGNNHLIGVCVHY